MIRSGHEYLPWPVIYLPVFPLAAWHALRLGHVAFFTNVDPAIDMGGFFGERKSEILDLLPSHAYPTTVLVHPGEVRADLEQRLARAGLRPPLVAKPDVGERGDGVRIVDTWQALWALLATLDRPYLLQERVAWPEEYGVMFVRDMGSGTTGVLSITGKRFLRVTGDGRSTVGELLRSDPRGRRQIPRLQRERPEMLTRVVDRGVPFLVEPIGNHCRGTAFLDASGLLTPELERSVNELMARVPGVHYGRLDVRAASREAFQAGRFTVLEINGVTAEPGHIYDPALGLWGCWRELLRHLRHVPVISRAMLRAGHKPTPVAQVWRRYRAHFAARPNAPGHSASIPTSTLCAR